MYNQLLFTSLHLLFSGGFYYLYDYMIQNNVFNVNYLKKGTVQSKVLSPEYRTVNIVKSITLGVLSVPTFYYYIDHEKYEYYVYQISLAGAIYSASDLSAIFFNPKAHNSTQVHHILVQVLYYYSMINNWNQHSIAYLIYIYSTYSIFAYLVNGRLAIREMDIVSYKEQIINDISLSIYALCCAINWTLQLYYLVTIQLIEPLYIQGLYCCLVALIIHDDIFLMKYLHKNAKYVTKDFLVFINKNNPLLLY